MTNELQERLSLIKKRYEEINLTLASLDLSKERELYLKLSKELKEIEPIYEAFREYSLMKKQIEDAKELLKSAELQELAREEINTLSEKIKLKERELRLMLIPKDPRDEKNVILEIRAGVGGEEAALFVADLLLMYQRYAESKNWKMTLLSSNRTGLGGLKEVITLIEGNGVYSFLKHETGVHRVQRIPVTESGGRIHTSTATVAVLPEADETEVQIDPKDLKIETFRASGAGGQYVNTTESAVRITHVPTGITVSCQDERSQFQNRQKAMKILYARLKDLYDKKREEELSRERRMQIGSAERSEKIRTYNFPQNRVTDHRINLTLYKLQEIMQGKLDEIILGLIEHELEQRLTALDIR
ncbi:MAG: peptide chain release factor 1 [Aquificaceae bacterium]